MAGQLNTYGADPNQAISKRASRSRAKTPAFLGLTVGKVVAIKLHDPKQRKDVTRLTLVFNEHTDTPQVLLFPANTAFESLRPDLTDQVVEKVRGFDEFLASQPERAAEAAEELGGDEADDGEVAEL